MPWPGICARGRCARRRHHRELRSHRHPARWPRCRRGARDHARHADPLWPGRRLGRQQHERRARAGRHQAAARAFRCRRWSPGRSPAVPCVIMSNSVHAYISQSDKGDLVIGAGTDAYTSYTQGGALHVNSHTLAAICELFDVPAHAHARNWGGIVDVTLRPLADHRQDAGAGAVRELVAGARLRPRRAPATCSRGRWRTTRRTRSTHRSRSSASAMGC